MRGLLIGAGLLAVLAGATPAAAAARAATPRAAALIRHVDVDRLRLAGGQVLLARRRGPRTETIDVVARGGRARRLATLTAGPPGACTGDSGSDGVDFGFDASAQALAASSTCTAEGQPTVTHVFAGAAGGAPAQLTTCSPPGLLRPPVAVTGTRVASVDDCAPDGSTLVVHDLAGGPDRRLALPPGHQQYYGAAEALQAAGPFVAYDLSTDTQPAAGVLDLRTGEQRALPLSGPALVTDVAVDAAGRVLLRRQVGDRCGIVELYAPGAQPTVVEPCADDAGIALVGGRPAYFAAGRLHAGDRIVARLAPKVSAAHLAFDGTLVAFDVPECGGRRDVVVARAAGPAARAAPLSCPFSIPAQQPQLAGARITVRARCPRGCADADMLLLSTGRHRRPLAVYTAFADARSVQRLSVTARTARALRRAGRTPAILRVGVRRIDGRYRFRERRVTILARRA